MTEVVRKTRAATVAPKAADVERLERELQWRSWFPDQNVAVLDSRRVIPDDEVKVLVEAFRKFCLEAVRIKVPGARVPFELRDAQLQTVEAWIRHRNNICLKARQIGFSTLTAVFALWVALGGADRQIYLLSRRELDSISLLNKAKFAWRSLPEWVRERAPGTVDKNKLVMTFENDSFIQSSPAAGDPITGETAYLVVVDEWAKFPDQEQAWASIEPTADIGGRVIGLSTAKGEGNFFHTMWLRAQSGASTFNPVFHPWQAVPERDDEWYELKRRDMEPWQLYQEYPSNPEEAFQGSGNPFYDMERLRELQVREPIGRFMLVRPEDGQRWSLDSDEFGPFWQWERPRPGRSYVIGADIAQGLEHGDWTVAYVMDAESGELAAMFRGKPEPDEFAGILVAMGYMYNHALLAPEVNNHGRSTVDHLRRLGYDRIYRRRSKLKAGGEAMTETIGWLTTHGNKHDICLELGVWLRSHNVPHQGTINELKTFIRTQRGEKIRLSGSPHDDCVMALAITVEARKYAIRNNIGSVKPEKVPGSIAWWEQKLSNRNTGRRKVRPGR